MIIRWKAFETQNLPTKQRQTMIQSKPRFSPQNNGTESGYALKDFMEGDDDFNKIPVTYR